MAELDPTERYQLRKLQMDVDKKDLEVQKAQQDLDRFAATSGNWRRSTDGTPSTTSQTPTGRRKSYAG